jgi:transcription initiation factor TFIIB
MQFSQKITPTMDCHSSSIEYELGLAEFAKTIQCNESNKLACPDHPQGLLIDDHRTGDIICTECGLVLGEKFEVPIYTPRRTPQQEYEPPPFQHYGLSRKEYNLSTALDQIATFADRIHLTRDIIESAQQLYIRVYRGIKGKSIDAIGGACLYIACRQKGVPRTFMEICAVTCASKDEIGRCYTKIMKHFRPPVDMMHISDLMSRFCSHLGLEASIEKLAKHIVARTRELDLAPGRSPISVAGAAIYLASGLKLRDIGRVVGVAPMTIKHVHKLMYPRRDELFE